MGHPASIRKLYVSALVFSFPQNGYKSLLALLLLGLGLKTAFDAITKETFSTHGIGFRSKPVEEFRPEWYHRVFVFVSGALLTVMAALYLFSDFPRKE